MDPDDRAASCIDIQTHVRQRDVAEQTKAYVRQLVLNEVLARLKSDAVKSLRLKGTKEAKRKAVQTLKDKMDGKGSR